MKCEMPLCRARATRRTEVIGRFRGVHATVVVLVCDLHLVKLLAWQDEVRGGARAAHPTKEKPT